MPKRAYHHGDLARAAVTEGMAALDELGVEALSVSEVARRAGVTHAALYKHFGGRDELLEAIVHACFDDLRDVLRRAAARPAGDPRKQFLAGGWSVVRYAWRHPHRYQLMFFGPRSESPDELAVAEPETAFGAFLDLISGWQQAGLVRRGDRAAIAMSVWSTTHGLASLLASGRIDVGSVHREVRRMALHRGTAGLLVRTSRHARFRPTQTSSVWRSGTRSTGIPRARCSRCRTSPPLGPKGGCIEWRPRELCEPRPMEVDELCLGTDSMYTDARPVCGGPASFVLRTNEEVEIHAATCEVTRDGRDLFVTATHDEHGVRGRVGPQPGIGLAHVASGSK